MVVIYMYEVLGTRLRFNAYLFLHAINNYIQRARALYCIKNFEFARRVDFKYMYSTMYQCSVHVWHETVCGSAVQGIYIMWEIIQY